MPKKIIWVFVIAAGVFLGVFGYEKFTEYRLQIALQTEYQKLEKLTEKIRLDQAQKNEQIRKSKFDRDTACAINEDQNTCVCISERTGIKINVGFEDCNKRAKEITW